MYRVLCARESLREKRVERIWLKVSCGEKTLTFQSKDFFSVNKRSTRSQNYKRFYCFFAVSSCSSSLRAWCVSLRRGAFLKYDLTIVLLHYTLRRRGCASRLFAFLSDSSGIIITYYVGSITHQ